MVTVKVDLQERTMSETALVNGLFVNQLFFRPSEYIEKTNIDLTLWFKCQKFGHISSSCELGQNFGKCAEKHNTDSCHQIGTKLQICQLSGTTLFSIKKCPARLKTTETLYQSRLVPLPNQLQDKIDRLITENKWPA